MDKKQLKPNLTIDNLTTAGVIFLTLTSFVLSYDAIRQLAVASGVNPALSWLYPLSVDAVALVAAVTVLRMTKARDSAVYPWFVTILFAIISITFNILHYDSGAEWYQTIVTPMSYAVHAIPPIAVMLGFHLLILQKENDIKRQMSKPYDKPMTKIGQPVKVPDNLSHNGNGHRTIPEQQPGQTNKEWRLAVLPVIADMTDAEAADKLGVSERTIKRDRMELS